MTANGATCLVLSEEGGVDVCFGPGVLAGDHHVRRREQEDLVGHSLDLAVQALRKSAREVDEATSVAIRHLREVDDDRDALAEAFSNDLSIAVLAGVNG